VGHTEGSSHEHDPVVGERRGDGALVRELHVGTLGHLLPAHTHVLDLADLAEEGHDLLSCNISFQVTDVHSATDLLNLGRVCVARQRWVLVQAERCQSRIIGCDHLYSMNTLKLTNNIAWPRRLPRQHTSHCRRGSL